MTDNQKKVPAAKTGESPAQKTTAGASFKPINVDKLLEKMIEMEGSDLFIAVGAPPMLATKGKMVKLANFELKPKQTEYMALGFMDDVQKEQFEQELELNIAYSIAGKGRFRLNIYRQRGSVGIVIRRITLEILTIEQLGLPEVLKDLAMTSRGLVLVTGATGSGKSTTLAAVIDYRNTNKDGHIVTIEDPLEYIHHHKKSIVSQREIGVDTRSYHNALKSALRQAPDVLLVGEIRDRETMEAAITFAETGHLVLSTLHSNNANQTLERILNFFPNEMHPMIHLQLSLNLRGVVCQRLIPTADGKSRAAVLEIMLSTPRVADLIHKGDTSGLKAVIAAGTHEGMQTFDQHLYELYKAGKVDYDTIMRAADSANDLKLRIKTEEGVSVEETTAEVDIESESELSADQLE